ncbi:MAG: hypothetical protein AB7H93_23440 [Vicinamibacterales bacterium]
MSATPDTPVRGRGRCPRCASRKVGRTELGETGFYGRTVEVCGNCGAAWEPLPPGGAHRDSDGSPFPFPDPCDNCAFRPGSPEQADREKWRTLLASLDEGGEFFCHKGVPIDPNGADGFAYPVKVDKAASAFAGQPVTVHDTRRLRTCRGYLNMLVAKWAKRGVGPED